MITKKFIFPALIMVGQTLYSQVGIGTANPRGALDINKETTNTMGLVLPANQNTSNIKNPQGGLVATGTMIYDLTADCVKVYKSTGWSPCICECDANPIVTSLDCSGILTGTYTANTASSGTKIISYTGGNGVAYPAISIASTGVTGLTATAPAGTLANGNGNITLAISGTPNASGTASFMITLGGETCTFTVNVIANGPLVTTLNCNGILTGIYTANTASSGTKIISYTGGNGVAYSAISISSTGVTGLTANAPAGTLANGNGNITLAISGTPSVSGTASFTINLGGKTCSFDISVLIPKKKILSVGDPAYALGGLTNYLQTPILTSSENFGANANSTVKIENISITHITPGSNQIQSLLDTYTPDILVATWGYIASESDAIAIKNFLDKGGRVMLCLQQANRGDRILNKIFGGTTSGTFVPSTGLLKKLTSINHTILNGPFGDVRGTYSGDDNDDTYTYFNSNITSSNVDILSGSEGSVVGFAHKTYKLFFWGDGGFILGYKNNTSTVSYPIAADSNYKPIGKTFGVNLPLNGVTQQTAYNSIIFANAMAWLMK